MDAFVPAGSGGLNGPTAVLFGPDRNGDSVPDLYVGSYLTNQVLVYSGADGTFLGVFVAAGSGGLNYSGPRKLDPRLSYSGGPGKGGRCHASASTTRRRSRPRSPWPRSGV